MGCHGALEPRDARDGSTFMMDWALYGGGDGSLGAGGGGGCPSVIYESFVFALGEANA